METLVLSTTIGIFLCFREISSHFLMFVGQVNDTQMAKKNLEWFLTIHYHKIKKDPWLWI